MSIRTLVIVLAITFALAAWIDDPALHRLGGQVVQVP